jgi:hypothetical protein
MSSAQALRLMLIAIVIGVACPSRASAQIVDSGPAPLPPDTLWYNGDGDPRWIGSGLHANMESTQTGQLQMVYEDCVVPDAVGWTITSVWSNN